MQRKNATEIWKWGRCGPGSQLRVAGPIVPGPRGGRARYKLGCRLVPQLSDGPRVTRALIRFVIIWCYGGSKKVVRDLANHSRFRRSVIYIYLDHQCCRNVAGVKRPKRVTACTVKMRQHRQYAALAAAGCLLFALLLHADAIEEKNIQEEEEDDFIVVEGKSDQLLQTGPMRRFTELDTCYLSMQRAYTWLTEFTISDFNVWNFEPLQSFFPPSDYKLLNIYRNWLQTCQKRKAGYALSRLFTSTNCNSHSRRN